MDLPTHPTTRAAPNKHRLNFRILDMPPRIFEELIGSDRQPRSNSCARSRGLQFRQFAKQLRGTKSSLLLIHGQGAEIYVPPKACCTAAAIVVYRAQLERSSSAAWIEWGWLAELRGIAYNSAYKQVRAFSRLLRRECDVHEDPFEAQRVRGAVRFSPELFEVEFHGH